jgi:hypothetical protein
MITMLKAFATLFVLAGGGAFICAITIACTHMSAVLDAEFHPIRSLLSLRARIVTRALSVIFLLSPFAAVIAMASGASYVLAIIWGLI